MIDWHRLPGRKGLALLLIITVSNKSIKVTAVFFELSLSTFGDVMIKTSVAYLNMLCTLTT
ncbi:PREDICTED: uncharacterized protein LOC105447850 [Wasmannia auropunctata]|uniref:uncharacterized protein LOC105447850 n=1 Tax=Wasmannia auropunctata TaxID=64793 RepID=UPI0005EEBA3B|nr:PREDICTED: uncharacterized protein LOC105447850 [Wasmannia auropunctata]